MRWLALIAMAVCLPAYAQTPDAPLPQGASPPAAPSAGSLRQAETARLLDALKAAPSEEVAAPLEAQITQIWLHAGSPAVMLLMARGLRELKAEAPQDAAQDLGAVITLQPDFTEAYDQRAIARFNSGDLPGAVADLQQALQHEPRDFGAFRTLEQIAELRGDWKSAYAAWQRLMAIDPKTPGGEEKLNDLRRRALGEET